MNYDEALRYILSFTDMERGVQVSNSPAQSLESMRSLLARLGNPQEGRRTIHVTGSKGKGSISTMVDAILREAGFRTSLYTSPHLHSFTERIAIDGLPVDEDVFAHGLEAIRAAVEAEQAATGGNVSTFGILTALFFWLAREAGAEWQVVEVGIGGTWDATNVFERVEAAIIGPVSLEHTHILGPTPEAIARDKSGIVKPGCVCILAPQRSPGVVEVVRERCEAVGAELVEVAASYRAERGEHHPWGQAFTVQGPGGRHHLRTPLLGWHQAENAMTAVATAEALAARGVPITPAAIAEGIARARIPGRLEVMGQRPLIVADGAHNAESAAALVRALREYFTWRRCFVVVGCTADKDVRGIGQALSRIADLLICTRFANPRAMDPYVLIQEIGFLGPAAVAEESVAGAIETARHHAREDDLIVVTGSLYVVAEGRAHVLGDAARTRR
ncbi:Folylpolyglutamate synthase [bacterium HR29]|nr:Folylpolyglutamate synthase [bacterium HR29]